MGVEEVTEYGGLASFQRKASRLNLGEESRLRPKGIVSVKGGGGGKGRENGVVCAVSIQSSVSGGE